MTMTSIASTCKSGSSSDYEFAETVKKSICEVYHSVPNVHISGCE